MRVWGICVDSAEAFRLNGVEDPDLTDRSDMSK